MLRRILAVIVLLLIGVWALQGQQRREEDPFAHVVRMLRPSIALLTVQVPGKDEHHHPDVDEVYGTAIIIKSNAKQSLLLTDAHVVAGASEIRVRLDDGRTYIGTTTAVNANQDAAFVRIDQGWLPLAQLGSSAEFEAGDPVGVAGYPIPDAFEDQHFNIALSVYAGRIASIRNTALELDVPIIPGESGGPVFDADNGIVIGIAESRFDDEKAIGFATPIESLRSFIDQGQL